MRKHTHRWCQTPPSVTVRVKPSSSHSIQKRRCLRFKRSNGQDTQGPPGKSQSSHCRDELYHAKMSTPPTIVIQMQEMASFFRLLDDDLIRDFLWMDCCCKMTDKYLLAMTFVYFKRAHFTIAEYTRKNLFIALYLANTMEEDEEEIKYEIFPWALGKNWRKQFPRFLQQRDLLWARINFRAAVSRRCCEEVMAIAPSHFVWKRVRSEHHSGAQRQYGDQEHTIIPRGPSASPLSCALCNQGTRSHQGPGFLSPSRGPSAQTSSPALPHPFTSILSLEITPPRASLQKTVGTKIQAQHLSSCCVGEVPRAEGSSGSSYDTSMDWISEE
ncbi:speedy protein A isoform X2 [Acanthopagrus latus]|uniref:speedy protein A isoform X2 n=1 Tax=Acanthopagrus latus TaxID=8177 RepID=UPI00187CD34B|nr:speedy protein A isoform X2 [Acanthopagrus latus]